MRSYFKVVLALLIVMGICCSILPYDSNAQTTDNLVQAKTDYEMLGASDLHGGGHLTYELRGRAAGDLRRAVLDRYDGYPTGTPNGVIDPQELRFSATQGYIADVETALMYTDFFAGSAISFNPLHHGQGDDITVDAQGFCTIAASAIATDDWTPVRIYLYFDAASNVPYPDFDLMPVRLFQALYLYDPMGATPEASSLIGTGQISPGQYSFKFKHTDYRIGLGAMYSLSPNMGSMHVIRTPAGEISMYSVTFSGWNSLSTQPETSSDNASYKSFNFVENPQILFILVFICAYMMASMPTRFYGNYKYAYPRRYRHKALKISWLHILSKVLILLLILFYFFPTMFAFISPSLFINGIAMWVICLLFAILIVIGAKLMYDAKINDIPSEYMTPQVRRVPTRRPAPQPQPRPAQKTTTPAGVSVVVQQAESKPSSKPKARPQPAPKPKPTGPPCTVCKKPITDFTDLVKCKCGELYHERCADVAGNCTSCGVALVDMPEPEPAKRTIQCPTCGEMNTILADADPISENCKACGVMLEKIEQGFNYLIVDNSPSTAFKMFVSVMKKGSAGLTISTTFPEKLRKEHDMSQAELIWLTDTSVPDQKTINPHRLEFEMMRMYSSFVKNNKDSAVILDGFEYLVVENGFDKVFKFIKKVNDLSSVNNATLFVPIGTSSLESDQLGTLKKEFDRVVVLADDE